MNVLFIEKACDGTVGGSHSCLYNLINFLDKRKFKIFVGFYQNNIYVDKLIQLGAEVYIIKRNPCTSKILLVRKILNWYRLIYLHRRELKNFVTSNNIELIVLNNTIAGGEDYIHICRKYSIPIIAYERAYLKYSDSDILLSSQLCASVAVSLAIKDNMLQQNYATNPIVIYDGLSTEIITLSETGRNDLKIQLGIPANSIVIGIVGNIREWKGQEYFVKAFMLLGVKYVNMYALVIGGRGIEDQKYVERLESLSKGSKVEDRLLYLGYREDVSKLWDILDVFIHASIRPEPFGMVLLEAMLHRVPVIATHFGGPVETLESGNCGLLVPPRDEKAIVNGVEKYLNCEIYRKEIVDRAYRRVKEDFNVMKTVNQIEILLQETKRSTE